jgi:general secretion pathway protein J
MLVSVLLLALLLAVAYGGMRVSARSADRGEAYIELVNRLRVTHQLLRAQIQRATPLPMVIDDTESIVFEGEAQRLRFVAPMPGYLGRGGAQIQEISFERSNGGLVMVFNHHYWETAEQPLRFEEVGAEPIVLLDRIESAEFLYMARPTADEESPEWQSEWENPAEIPWLVALNLEFNESVPVLWPELLVAPLIDNADNQQDDWLAPYRRPGDRRTRQ